MALPPFEKLLAMMTLGLTGFVALGWVTLLVMPFGWSKRVTVFYSLDIGLYRVVLGPGVTQKVLGAVTESITSKQLNQKFSQLLKEQGTFNLQDFRAFMCQLNFVGIGNIFGGDPCYIFQTLQYGSWALLILGGFGLTFLVGAGCVLYHWAFVKARKRSRQWAMGLYATAAVIFALGTAQYCFVSYEVRNMPPGPTDGTTWGFCVMGAFTLIFASIAPIGMSAFLSQADDAGFSSALGKQFGQPGPQGPQYGASSGPPPEWQQKLGPQYGATGMPPPGWQQQPLGPYSYPEAAGQWSGGAALQQPHFWGPEPQASPLGFGAQ